MTSPFPLWESMHQKWSYWKWLNLTEFMGLLGIWRKPLCPDRTSTNACCLVCKYVDRKGSAAMLTPIQSAGVTPEMNLRITQVKKHAWDPPWLWNPGQTSPEVQNRDISGSMKRINDLKNFLKKQKKRKLLCQNKLWQFKFFSLLKCAESVFNLISKTGKFWRKDVT